MDKLMQGAMGSKRGPMDVVAFEVSSKRRLPVILECPVCAEVLTPPVYNCLLGHSVCSKCQKSLKKCGICMSSISGSRNYIVEEIIRDCKFACEYRTDGCLEMLEGSGYEKHVDDCPFRPINCCWNHLDMCMHTWLNFKDYESHLASFHKLPLLLGKNGMFTVFKTFHDPSFKDTKIWRGARFIYDSKTFVTLTVLEEQTFKFSMCILDSALAAKNYKVKVSFKRPVKVKWNIQEPPAQIIPVLPVRELKSFTLPYNHVGLKYEILTRFCLIEGDANFTPASFEWLNIYEIFKSSPPIVDLTVM